MEELKGCGPFLHLLVRKGARLWGGHSDVGQGGKMVFLEKLMEEQMMKLVGVELWRSSDGEGWLIQVWDQAGAVVTVGIGAGEDESEAKERAAGIILRYFNTLYT